MSRLTLLIICLLLLGCTPKQNAQARAIDAQTNRRNDLHDLALAREIAVNPDQVAAKRFYIWFGASFIFAVGTVTAIAYAFFAVGTAKAAVKQAHLQAQLIPLDVATRQYPLLLHETKGRLYLLNPNNGQLQRLGKAAPAHPALIAGSHDVQRLGVSDSRPLMLQGPQ